MIKKILILLLLLIANLISIPLVASVPADIYTPLCTKVKSVFYYTELSESELAALDLLYQTAYPNAIMIDHSSGLYDCHAYAWIMSEGGETVWLNLLGVYDYIFDNSYIIDDAQNEGDKVFYSTNNHSAVATNTPEWVIAKWGPGPLMFHQILDCPYWPAPYGDSTYPVYYTSIRKMEGTINSGTYKIGNQIRASGQVAASANVNFQAGKSILLTTGFKVQNATLHAEIINSCWPNGGLKSTNPLTDAKNSNEIINSGFSENPSTKEVLVSERFGSEIICYPNPMTNKLFIKGLSDFDASIFDLSGRRVLNIIKANVNIDMSGLNTGIYMLHLKSGDKIYIQKVVKQ